MVELPPTTPVELDLGDRVLRLEQARDLGALAVASVVSHGPEPYWAYLWPSARALARFAASLEDLEGKRALDLGCGLGAVGIAVATRGASVIAADLRPEAVELTRRNASLAGVTLDARTLDWNEEHEELGALDLIFAADVFYGDGMLAAVLRFLKRHLAPDGVAYVADPKRLAPSGVAGAARFHGLVTLDRPLAEGETMTGGVTLFELRRRRRS